MNSVMHIVYPYDYGNVYNTLYGNPTGYEWNYYTLLRAYNNIPFSLTDNIQTEIRCMLLELK